MPESKLMLVFRGGREFADECDQEGRRLDRATGERTQAENTGTYGTATLGTATLDTATLETATLANARMQTARWHESWEHRLNCWWHRLPLASQARLDGCLGALALHLGARLDLALRRATAAPVAVGAECAWVGEMLRADELMLPEFPPLDRVEFSVPLLPELLVPSTRWRQMVSRSGRRGDDAKLVDAQLVDAQLVRSHPSEAKWQADGVGSGYEFGHEFGQVGRLGTLMAPQRSRLLAVSPGCGVGVAVGVGLGLFFFIPLCISSSSRRVRLRKRLQTERAGSTLASTISRQT